MDMHGNLFYGCGTALVTPFKGNRVDFDALEGLIDWQLDCGADAIVVLGTTGEPATVTESERSAIVECAAARCLHRAPLVVGTGSNDTRYCLQMSRFAASAGADGLLLVTPYTLLYFAVCGETPESRLRYRLQMQRLAKHYCLLLSGLHYTIDNPQNIRLGEQPSVIISNHQSHIDIMLILSQTPKMAIMVKDYIWNNPIFHTVARKLDCFPLSLDEEAKQTLIQRVTDEGYSLMVFPEGTRTTTGEIGRFHRGAAYYAHLLQLPVQPLLLEGMCDYLSRRQFAIKPNNVTLHILPLIPHDEL